MKIYSKYCSLCLAVLMCIFSNFVPTEATDYVECKHIESEWIEEVSSGLAKNGLESLKCKMCGYKQKWRFVEPLYSNEYSDVDEKQWYHEAAVFVSSNNIMNGTGVLEFSPNSIMNRAMAVVSIHRLECFLPNPYYTGGFFDVQPLTWYSGSVGWASNAGIVNGVGEQKFDPFGHVTREQFVTMLYRYSSNVLKSDADDFVSLDEYSDVSEINLYAKEAFSWAVAKGIVKGVSSNELAPQQYCTRAQAAQMIKNFCDNIYPDMNSNARLVVNGKDLTDGNCVAIHRAFGHAVLSFIPIAEELGAKIEWKSETVACISIAGKELVLDVENVTLVDESKNFDLFSTPPGGNRIMIFKEIIDDELIVDDTAIRQFIIYANCYITVDSNNNQVLITSKSN